MTSSQDIWHIIFQSQEWKDEIEKEKLSALFIGNGLQKANDTSSVNWKDGDDIYLVLCFAKESSTYPLQDYPKGFPLKELFEKSLRPWEWANEDRRDILLGGTNITLNVSEYYRTMEPTTLMLDQQVDIHKLLGTFNNGDEKNFQTDACIHGEECIKAEIHVMDDSLFIIVQLWDKVRVWHCRTAVGESRGV